MVKVSEDSKVAIAKISGFLAAIVLFSVVLYCMVIAIFGSVEKLGEFIKLSNSWFYAKEYLKETYPDEKFEHLRNNGVTICLFQNDSTQEIITVKCDDGNYSDNFTAILTKSTVQQYLNSVMLCDYFMNMDANSGVINIFISKPLSITTIVNEECPVYCELVFYYVDKNTLAELKGRNMHDEIDCNFIGRVVFAEDSIIFSEYK